MTKLLQTFDEYIEAIDYIVESKPEFIYIATYGIYLGVSINNDHTVTDWHEKYPRQMRSVIDKIIEKNIKCKIIVGDDEDKPRCHDNCEYCIENNKKQILRLMAHIEKFSKNNIEIISKDNFHMKMFLSNKYYVLGGRNFTESKYDDISFLGNEKGLLTELKEVFDASFV